MKSIFTFAFLVIIFMFALGNKDKQTQEKIKITSEKEVEALENSIFQNYSFIAGQRYSYIGFSKKEMSLVADTKHFGSIKTLKPFQFIVYSNSASKLNDLQIKLAEEGFLTSYVNLSSLTIYVEMGNSFESPTLTLKNIIESYDTIE